MYQARMGKDPIVVTHKEGGNLQVSPKYSFVEKNQNNMKFKTYTIGDCTIMLGKK